MDRVSAVFSDTAPSSEEVTAAFWGACHGGQLAMAQYLLDRGADLNWVCWDDHTPLDAAERSGADDVVAWLTNHGAESAPRSPE